MDHNFFKISDTVDLKLAYSGGIRNAVLFFSWVHLNMY